MAQRLNQVVAARTGVQGRNQKAIMELLKVARQEPLFTGLHREYKPQKDDDYVYPSETKKVQMTVDSLLVEAMRLFTPMIDLNLENEEGNAVARADIELDGEVVATGVPAAMLLFLEKTLREVRDLVSALPTNDHAEEWKKDTNTGLWKTDPHGTHKTKKVPKVVTLAEATKEHPAQAQLTQEDIVEGTWYTTKFSGAVPEVEKKKYLERIDRLTVAIKKAREQANMQEVQKHEIAKKIFDKIFVA